MFTKQQTKHQQSGNYWGVKRSKREFNFTNFNTLMPHFYMRGVGRPTPRFTISARILKRAELQDVETIERMVSTLQKKERKKTSHFG